MMKAVECSIAIQTAALFLYYIRVEFYKDIIEEVTLLLLFSDNYPNLPVM